MAREELLIEEMESVKDRERQCCFDCAYALACGATCEKFSSQSEQGGNWKCAPENMCNGCIHFKEMKNNSQFKEREYGKE